MLYNFFCSFSLLSDGEGPLLLLLLLLLALWRWRLPLLDSPSLQPTTWPLPPLFLCCSCCPCCCCCCCCCCCYCLEVLHAVVLMLLSFTPEPADLLFYPWVWLALAQHMPLFHHVLPLQLRNLVKITQLVLSPWHLGSQSCPSRFLGPGTCPSCRSSVCPSTAVSCFALQACLHATVHE